MNKEEQIWEKDLQVESRVGSEGTINFNKNSSSENKRRKGMSIKLGFRGKRGVTAVEGIINNHYL
jgi:hypothetical protein